MPSPQPLPPELAARATQWLGKGSWQADGPAAFERPWLAIASSRLGRKLAQQRDALAMLRAMFADAQRRGLAIAWGAGTAVDAIVHRAVELLQVPGIRIAIEDRGEQAGIDTPKSMGPSPMAANVTTVTGRFTLTESAPFPFPRRDCAAVGLAPQLAVLHVRAGGAMEHLVRRRLGESPLRPECTRVAATTAAARRLIADGAVGWFPIHGAHSHTDRCETAEDPAISLAEFEDAQSGRTSAAGRTEYLVHCTRSRDLATPGFDPRSQLDRLLLTSTVARDDARANLIRMLRSGWLRGTHHLTRGGTRVVSFSATPLANLLACRQFRPHLGRWDYEPYGIAIRREILQSRGARPVRYFDDNAAPPEESPEFLQPRGVTYDWAYEREWRLLGDLSLQEIDREAAFVFVASPADVAAVQRWSRWSVVYCNETEAG